jgi:chromosome segregation ATPase
MTKEIAEIVRELRAVASHVRITGYGSDAERISKAADHLEAVQTPQEEKDMKARVQELEAELADVREDLSTKEAERIFEQQEAMRADAKVQELERENAITEGAHELTARTLAKARDQIKELERPVDDRAFQWSLDARRT